MQHFPATWAIGASKMRAKHNEHRTWDTGGTHAIHYPVKKALLPGLWKAMLSTLSDPRLSIFRGMFIIIQTYGTKLVWNDTFFSTLRTTVLNDLNKSINREHLVREKTYFDVGKETVSALGRIQWWKTCCLQDWLASIDPKTHVASRLYPVSGTRDAAAINITPTQKHFMHPDVVYAQRYSSYKELRDAGNIFPFTNLNIESMLIPASLLQLWAKAGGSHGRSNHVQRLVTDAGKSSYTESKKRVHLALKDSQSESFGTREEYRVLLKVFEELDLDSRPCRRTEPRPYYSVPTAEALLFLRWEANRWLGALDHLLTIRDQLTPASGAMGTMLARVLRTIINDGALRHSSDLYCDDYLTKKGFQWLGLGLKGSMEDTGMPWLKSSMFDWEQMQFCESIQNQIRFFIPDSQRTYTERRKQVSNITRLYTGIDEIAKSLQNNGLPAENDHKLDRIRRICFLALTLEVLNYDVGHQQGPAPKDLQSYNYGICKSWLSQYYIKDREFRIPRDWRIGVTWKERPTWAALIQQLFDWDDQHLYKNPFTRNRWMNLQYRLITRHAFDQVLRQLGQHMADDWKSSLGTHGCQFFWMLPKCSSDRFGSQTKVTEGSGMAKRRSNYMSWYSASHAQLSKCRNDQDPRTWDWADQSLWDWQGGSVMEHKPLCFFDNLEEFDFQPNTSSRIIPQPERLIECPAYKVEKILGRRELTPRAIDYLI